MDPTALYKISYGLYVITSKKGDEINGQTANALIQVTGEPPQLAIGINTQNLTNEFIKDSGVFGVSILSQETPLEFIGQFGFKSGRDINKFENVNYKTGTTGTPLVIDNTLAVLEAKVKHQMDVGTHTIFVGEIVESEVFKEGEPMTYAYYHQVKRGTTPKTAPTFRGGEEKEKSTTPGYQCSICGYTYEQEKGDPDGGIAPGTPFEEIPDSWVCPVCGAGKDQFKQV
jgi:flavin reductase (DIM6/NTAB) family NADH-FMN oxidoreductase RutF/rubredoxin